MQVTDWYLISYGALYHKPHSQGTYSVVLEIVILRLSLFPFYGFHNPLFVILVCVLDKPAHNPTYVNHVTFYITVMQGNNIMCSRKVPQ